MKLLKTQHCLRGQLKLSDRSSFSRFMSQAISEIKGGMKGKRGRTKASGAEVY